VHGCIMSDWLAAWLACCLAAWHGCWLVGLLLGWFALHGLLLGWFAAWLGCLAWFAAWLVCCLAAWLIRPGWLLGWFAAWLLGCLAWLPMASTNTQSYFAMYASMASYVSIAWRLLFSWSLKAALASAVPNIQQTIQQTKQANNQTTKPTGNQLINKHSLVIIYISKLIICLITIFILTKTYISPNDDVMRNHCGNLSL
jgi:hypothetical protein